MHSVDKPAIVHEHIDLQQLAAEIKAKTDEAKIVAKKNIGDWVAIGKLLEKAKAAVGQGNWTKWLNREVGYSQQHANRLMRLAKMANHSKTSELREAWKTLCGNDEKGGAVKRILCDHCAGMKRRGVEKSEMRKGCHDCKLARAAAKLDAKKAGDPVFNWKCWESAFSVTICGPDVIAKHYPEVKKLPEFEEFQKNMGKVLGFVEGLHKTLIKGKK